MLLLHELQASGSEFTDTSSGHTVLSSLYDMSLLVVASELRLISHVCRAGSCPLQLQPSESCSCTVVTQHS